MTLPGTWRPSKIYKRTRQKSTRKGATRFTATLKELQEHLTSTDYSLHVRLISCIARISDLWDRMARQEPFLT